MGTKDDGKLKIGDKVLYQVKSLGQQPLIEVEIANMTTNGSAIMIKNLADNPFNWDLWIFTEDIVGKLEKQ